MVGMRLWVRAGVIKQLGIDDYACILALVREKKKKKNNHLATRY